MRPIRLIPLILLALAACADSPEPAPSPGAFSFSISPSGEGNVTTTLNIPSFRITAYSHHSGEQDWNIIMDNVVVTRTGLNSWTYSPAVDWPEGRVVDFYAVSPDTHRIVSNPWWHTTLHFYETDGSEDLLIATRLVVDQSGRRIKINFRHALARVSFVLKASRPGVSARVRKLRICNIAREGNFYFPTFTTSSDLTPGDIKDCWHIYNLTSTFYTIFEGTDGGYLLVDEEPVAVGLPNYFYIPATLVFYDPPIHWEGANLEVEYQLLDADQNATTSWTTAKIALSPSTPGSEWLPGTSYRYTLDLTPQDSRRLLPPSKQRDPRPVATCDTLPY